jgi:hypothetical protein
MTLSNLKRRVALVCMPAMLTFSLAAGAQNHGNFNNGLRGGGRGGSYNQGYNNHYDHGDRYRNDDRNRPGGIGPGKGALIGAGGGALLGGLLGGGVKGALIGGAAGAGIGAIAGKAHQNSQRDNYYRR